jgi:hypothetical protein
MGEGGMKATRDSEPYPSAEPHLPRPFEVCSFWECKFPLAVPGALPGKFKNSSLLFVPVAFPKRHSPGNTASPRVCFHSTSKRLGSKAPIPARIPRAFWSLSSLRQARIRPHTESHFPADSCSTSRGIFNRLNFLPCFVWLQPKTFNHLRCRHDCCDSGHPGVSV